MAERKEDVTSRHVPTIVSGLVHLGMGEHDAKVEGSNEHGNKVTGYGSDLEKARSDYRNKGGK